MPGRTFAHYCLLRSLGSGATGEVFHAEDLRDGEHVALKLLRSRVSSDLHAIERLKRDVQHASALGHPHICAVKEMDEYDGRHFVATPLLEGRSLADAIASGAMDPGPLATLAQQAADALAAAHEAGLVHRRIKPGNMFLCQREQSVCLLDFGLPRMTDLPDDPGYVAPEELLRREPDARSDLFSFGVVLYELATGCRLFTGLTQKTVANAILHDAPPSPARVNPRVPAGLDWIIHHALEKKPHLRYQSGLEMRDDLERLRRAEMLAAAV